MKINFKKGFTLIELLMVVAIIGVLAAIVVGALNSSKRKGEDAALQSELVSLKSQAEIYSNGGSYSNMFTGNNTWASADSAVQALLTSIDKKSTVHTAGSSVNAWAAQVQSKNDASKYMCVSNLRSVSISSTAMSAGATVCP